MRLLSRRPLVGLTAVVGAHDVFVEWEETTKQPPQKYYSDDQPKHYEIFWYTFGATNNFSHILAQNGQKNNSRKEDQF